MNRDQEIHMLILFSKKLQNYEIIFEHSAAAKDDSEMSLPVI